MSQTTALSNNRDVPFSKSKNSVQVSEPNIFYSSTTSSWKHLIFLWTLTASIHNPSLAVLTWLKLFLSYLSASLLLTSESICSGRIQMTNRKLFCKRTENLIFPHHVKTRLSSQDPSQGRVLSGLPDGTYIQCSTHPIYYLQYTIYYEIL